MSGPANLQGIDYQVSYTVLEVLRLLRSSQEKVRAIRFDSISDDEEDLTLLYEGGEEVFVQIKKKTEGYQWTPSLLRPILERFNAKVATGAKFIFVTDRGVNLEVAKLKRTLQAGTVPDDETLDKFASTTLGRDALRRLLPRINILSDYYASPDVSDPARTLKEQIKAVLLSRPFVLEAPVDTVIRSLWHFVFTAARAGALVTSAQLNEELRRAGISKIVPDWSTFPSVSDFIGRVEELGALLQIAESSSRIIVRGMSGMGKTLLLGRVAERLQMLGRAVLWISISPLTSPAMIARRLEAFFLDRFDFNPLLDVKLEDLPAVLEAFLSALKMRDLCVFIDAVDRAAPLTRSFIEGIVSSSIALPLSSTLIISSSESLACYGEVEIERSLVSEFHLGGYSVEDSRTVVKRLSIPLDDDAADAFHAAVGGHPMSYMFLREVCNSSQVEPALLIKQGLGRMQQWLKDRVIRVMHQDDQRVLRRLSVFSYPFDDAEVESALDSDLAAPHVIIGLLRRNLVVRTENTYVIHEALRTIAYEQNTHRTRIELHARCSAYYMGRIRKLERANGQEFDDLAIKWTLHTELATDAPCQTQGIRSVISCSLTDLDILWAIHRFNYPFSFSSDDVEGIEAKLSRLTDAGLIRSEPSTVEGAPPGSLMYKLVFDDFESVLFLSEICCARGASADLGYIPQFQPNWNFEHQGLMCEWEHCIELSPLPPLTRRAHQEHIDFIREGFANGRYSDSEPSRVEFLRGILERGVPDDAPDEPDLKMMAASCPIFGHVCPAGQTQADECRIALGEISDNDRARGPAEDDDDATETDPDNVE